QSSPASSPTAADDLAGGLDSPAALGQLAILQNHINRAVVAAAAQDETARDPLAAAAWDALIRLERQAPNAVAQVFDHAHLRVWVGRGEREADCDKPPPTRAHLLQALALSAAVRARTHGGSGTSPRRSRSSTRTCPGTRTACGLVCARSSRSCRTPRDACAAQALGTRSDRSASRVPRIPNRWRFCSATSSSTSNSRP